MAKVKDNTSNPEPATSSTACASKGLPDGHLSSVKQLQLDISFAEYAYHASITRAREKEANDKYLRDQEGSSSSSSSTLAARIKSMLNTGSTKARQTPASQEVADEHQAHVSQQDSNDRTSGPKEQSIVHSAAVVPTSPTSSSSSELHTANRALRTAGWGSVFYLITLDIMGPSNTPWAFAQTGYGPGFALYFAVGVLSAYSGWILWKIFLGLDSDRFPVRNYGDLFLRLYGPGFGYFVHFGQAVQLILSIAYIILLNGQAISQISQWKTPGTGGLCFIICVLIFSLAGMVAGQVRTFQRFSWLANLSVFIQLIQCLLVMGLVAHIAPNFAAIEASFGMPPGPIQTFAGTPPDGLKTGGDGSAAGINAAAQAVLASGGCMFFPAFMAEMRHPMDFWKGLLLGQAALAAVYIAFGAEVYHFYGQFAYLPIVQGIGDYGWRTALNALSIVAGLVATCLYTNVGLKIAYAEVLQPMGLPPLTTKGGKIWWAALVPVVWAVGFVLAPAIPQLAYTSSFGGALFGIGFSYVFPALGALGYFIRQDAVVADVEVFDEARRTYHYADHGWQRFSRAVMKRPLLHLWNLVYLICALATCILGCYTAVEQLILVFQAGVVTSFTCASPV